MQTRFNKLFAITVGLLVICCLILVLMLQNQGPHVRNSSFDNSGYRTVITLNFSAPLLPDQQVDQYITVQPSAVFSANHTGSQITVVFQQNLSADSEYRVTVNAGLKDTRGVAGERVYVTDFNTEPARFTYLKRNYDCNKKSNSEICNDQIVERQIGSNNEVVLSEAEHIKTFDRNRDWLVVLRAENEETDVLYAVNLKTKETVRVPIFGYEKVDKLSISPTSSVVAFTTTQLKGSFTVKLSAYMLDQARFYEIKPPGDDNGVSYFAFSNDGNSLLYEDFNQSYFVTNPLTPNYTPVLLGSYSQSGSFNFNDSKIIFQKGAVQNVVYDSKTQETRSIYLSDSVTKLAFASTSNDIFAIEFIYGTTSYTTKIIKYQNESEDFYRPNNEMNIDGFVSSPDDEHMLIEVSPIKTTYDTDKLYSGYSRPKNGQLVLYDTKSKKELLVLDGINPVWTY